MKMIKKKNVVDYAVGMSVLDELKQRRSYVKPKANNELLLDDVLKIITTKEEQQQNMEAVCGVLGDTSQKEMLSKLGIDIL